MSDDHEDKLKVSGRTIDLPNGRHVFVGTSEVPDTFYIEFKSESGEETRVIISREAKDALTALLVSSDTPTERWIEVPTP
jgi:hypothetical protein